MNRCLCKALGNRNIPQCHLTSRDRPAMNAPRVKPMQGFSTQICLPQRPKALNPNIGALVIRIGFWAQYTIVIIRHPQNGIGNYVGPLSYSRVIIRHPQNGSNLVVLGPVYYSYEL